MPRILGLGIGVSPDLQVRCKTASRERLLATTLTGYEAKLCNQPGRARPRRGVPELRPLDFAPKIVDDPLGCVLLPGLVFPLGLKLHGLRSPTIFPNMKSFIDRAVRLAPVLDPGPTAAHH